MFHALFWRFGVKTLSEALFSPPLMNPGYGGYGAYGARYPGVFKVCESARFESSARGLVSAGESMPDLKTPENILPEDMKCKSSGFVAE